MANKLFLSSMAGLSPTSKYAVFNADENHVTYDWLERIAVGPSISDGVFPTSIVAYPGFEDHTLIYDPSGPTLYVYRADHTLLWSAPSPLSESIRGVYVFPNRDEYLLFYLDGFVNVAYQVRSITTNSFIRTVVTPLGNAFNAGSGNPTNGDVYVTGNATSTTAPHFVKYNSSGTLQASVNWRSSTTGSLNSIHVDPSDGACIITASSSIANYQATGFRTVKFDAAGLYQWGTNNFSSAIAFDSNSNVYALQFDSSWQFVGLIKTNAAGTVQYTTTPHTTMPLMTGASFESRSAYSLIVTPDDTKILYSVISEIWVFNTANGDLVTNYSTYRQYPSSVTTFPSYIRIAYRPYSNTFFTVTNQNFTDISSGTHSLASFDTVTGEMNYLPDTGVANGRLYSSIAFDSTNSILAMYGATYVDHLEKYTRTFRATKNHGILANRLHNWSGSELEESSIRYSNICINPVTKDVYIAQRAVDNTVARRKLFVLSEDLSNSTYYDNFYEARALAFTSDGYLYACMRNFVDAISTNDICLYSGTMQLQWREEKTTTVSGIAVYEDDVITCHVGAVDTDRVVARYRKIDKHLEWSQTISVGSSDNTVVTIDSNTGIVYLWTAGSTTIRTISATGIVGATYACPNSLLVHSAYFDIDNKILILLGLFSDYTTLRAFDINNSGASLWSKNIHDEGVPVMYTGVNSGFGNLQQGASGALWYDSWPVKDNFFMLPPPTGLQVSSISDTQATVSWTWSET